MQAAYDSVKAKENYYDSLFSEQQYTRIIDECGKNEINMFNKLNTDNLIAAFFFMGDTVKAQQLITDEISGRIAASSATDLLFSDCIGYLNFVDIDTNRNFILSKILKLQTEEQVSDTANAKQILLFYIQDQYLRRLRNKSYGKYKVAFSSKNLIRNNIIDSLIVLNDGIYKYYNTTNKLFSKGEVGSIYIEQKVFLMHDAQT